MEMPFHLSALLWLYYQQSSDGACREYWYCTRWNQSGTKT